MAQSISCQFFGTTSIYIDDGSTGIFIDAFFSRPSILRTALGKISPDSERITQALSHGKISRLDGIFVAHSHFDHAMDAPEVIKRLGGKLYGSESTLNIGRGAQLSESSMQRIRDDETYTLGSFTIRIFEGIHSPGNKFPGTIDTPLQAPARASAYRDGGCFSFYITHALGSILIHPSANFVPEKFSTVGPVDIFFLGVGVLGAQDEAFQREYWKQTVEATKPNLIVPVHWDNFFQKLKVPLSPLPTWLDKFEATKSLLQRKEKEGWKVKWLQPFESVTLGQNPVGG